MGRRKKQIKSLESKVKKLEEKLLGVEDELRGNILFDFGWGEYGSIASRIALLEIKSNIDDHDRNSYTDFRNDYGKVVDVIQQEEIDSEKKCQQMSDAYVQLRKKYFSYLQEIQKER